MKLQLKHLIPGPLELFSAAFLSIVIILLANSRRLLGYYGLQGSDQLIKSSADSTVGEGLKAIDSFRATNSVVTFLIWAVVGVFCFVLVEAIGNAVREVRLQKQVSSANYMHPANFTQSSFWSGVILNSVTLAVGLLILAIVSFGFILLVVPLGLAYSTVFLFDMSAGTFINIVIGVLLVFVGLTVLDVTIRSLLYRRSILKLT